MADGFTTILLALRIRFSVIIAEYWVNSKSIINMLLSDSDQTSSPLSTEATHPRHALY